LKPFDINGAFLPSIPGGGDKLRHVAVRSAGVTVLSGGFTVAIQMLATVVLARLLTPRDFGLVAMATTFSLLFVNFGLNGITEAVIQKNGSIGPWLRTYSGLTSVSGCCLLCALPPPHL